MHMLQRARQDSPSRDWFSWLPAVDKRVVVAGLACTPALLYLLASRRRNTDATTTEFDHFLKVKRQPQQRQRQVKPTSTKQDSTNFSSFLLKAPAAPKAFDSTDFSTFLRSSGSAAATAPPAEDAPNAAAKGPSPEQVQVPVLFGTEYGFSKEIAEKLCGMLQATGTYWPVLVDMAEHPEGYPLSGEQVAFLVCSTQGDGVPPTEAREFCDWLVAGKAGDLSALHYSVCALGDRSYTHYCRCGKQLDAALAAGGGTEVVARMDVNKEDWAGVDAWLAAVVAALPTLPLGTVAERGGVAATAVAPTAAGASKRWGKSRPYLARVVRVEGLCAVSGPEDKDTYRVELDLGDSGLRYLPGDALGIHACNPPQVVEELLALLGADGSERVATPSWHYTLEGVAPQPTLALREALLRCYDLRTPKIDLFKLLQTLVPPSTPPADATAEVTVVAAPPSTNKAAPAATPAGAAPAAALHRLLSSPPAMEEYLTPRHVSDILADFLPAASNGSMPLPALTPSALLRALRPLQPRLYSISSSPLEAPASVQATIAAVKYQALGRPRLGVCSTHVSERLAPGDAVPVYIHPNPDFRLPADPALPIIMVGPGTGLAPFRAFILERALAAEAAAGGPPPGPMVLYFGCRRSDQDYLYGAQLEEWAAEGVLELHTAFSREGTAKVYVQQRLWETRRRVWELLQAGAHLYVCGDAARMAGDVEAALLRLIAEGLGAESEPAAGAAARAYLDGLSAAGRYQRDVWY